MPLVLAENEATESGITYEDHTGVSYQYPRMYRKVIQPGERFVYYRGRKRPDGRRLPQVYFGTGVVGIVSGDAANGALLRCQILDYRPFAKPVPFRHGATYLETGGSRRGYFQRGVRTITTAEFTAILDAALFAEDGSSAADQTVKIGTLAEPAYASPETLRLIEEFAVKVAVTEIQRRCPGAQIRILPRNNPGFDIEVETANGTMYVEVKGTARGAQFFITEGELQFSRHHESQYRLIVVHRIDLARGSYSVDWREGPISDGAGFALRPVQWACGLIEPSGQAFGGFSARDIESPRDP